VTLDILYLNSVINRTGVIPMNSLHVPKYDVREMNSTSIFQAWEKAQAKCL
jgi:hypothetical protein